MKCPNCNGQRYKAPDVPCGRCSGKGIIKPLTNEEYIRTCSTEELVNFLSKWSFCDFCPYQLSAQCSWKDGDCAYGEKNNEECFSEWLKEIHHDM